MSIDCVKIKETFKSKMPTIKGRSEKLFNSIMSYVMIEKKTFIDTIELQIKDKANSTQINIINKSIKNNKIKNIKLDDIGAIPVAKQGELITLVNNFVMCLKMDILNLLKKKILEETNKNMPNIIKNFNNNIKKMTL